MNFLKIKPKSKAMPWNQK